MHIKFSRRIKTRITQNGYRDKNIKTYFTPVPATDKSTTSERLSDKSFTLLSPFTGLLKKQLFYPFRETIKLGCKNVLQSQKIQQFFWSKTSNSAELLMNSLDELKHQILPIKLSLEYKVLNYFMKLTSNQLPIFEKLHLPTSNLRYSHGTKKYCVNHKINSSALENSILNIDSTLHNKFLNVSFFKNIIEMDARPIVLKKHLKMFFFHLFKQNTNNASYGKASWKCFMFSQYHCRNLNRNRFSLFHLYSDLHCPFSCFAVNNLIGIQCVFFN